MGEANSEKSVLSVEELVNLDDLEFESHAVTDAPAAGVVLHKGNSRVWTPIAAKTCSRLKHPSIPFTINYNTAAPIVVCFCEK